MAYKDSYSKLFTPPKFLERPAVAVEILPDRFSYLTTKITEKGLLPDLYGSVALKEGTLSLGEIIKREAVIDALAEIKKKTGVSFARFSLPEEKTYIFKTNLPKLTPKEIRDILDFKIEENIPLSSKEAVFDYDIIPNRTPANNLSVVVSVAPLKVVEEWQDLFQEAGLTPILFSPESNNVAKAVIKENNEQIIVTVNIKESNIILSLVVFGVVCQTSSLNFGSTIFTDLLAKYFKVSKEEAVKIKKEKLYNDNPENMEIFSYLINTISAIKDEIFKFISYCNEREDITGQVERVILCGPDAMITGFDKYLALNLGLRVETANIWTNNFALEEKVPEINRLESMNLTVVNGLSLF